MLADIESTYAQQAAAKTELLQWIGKKSPQFERIFHSLLSFFIIIVHLFWFKIDHVSMAQRLRYTACSKETIPFLMEKLSEELEDTSASDLPVLRYIFISRAYLTS